METVDEAAGEVANVVCRRSASPYRKDNPKSKSPPRIGDENETK
jgi:hypothetical protein